MTILQKTPADYVSALERAATRRTTPIPNGEIVWHIWGTGKPLVLLHGGTGSWLHWVRNIEALARDAMVVVPDIPGSGESGDPVRPITGKGIAETIFHGLNTIIGADTHYSIAGFSMGGLIAGFLTQFAGARADVPRARRRDRDRRTARHDGIDEVLAAASDRRGETRGAPGESRASS